MSSVLLSYGLVTNTLEFPFLVTKSQKAGGRRALRREKGGFRIEGGCGRVLNYVLYVYGSVVSVTGCVCVEGCSSRTAGGGCDSRWSN